MERQLLPNVALCIACCHPASAMPPHLDGCKAALLYMHDPAPLPHGARYISSTYICAHTHGTEATGIWPWALELS